MVDRSAAAIDHAFWRGRRVLVTGHTGFKGGWLALWLARLGATVTGVGLEPQQSPSLFVSAGISKIIESHFVDIRDKDATLRCIHEARPEIVFHLAAQPLVRESYRQPVETFATNLMGTVHILEALRQTPNVRVAVMITTDKVYTNHEWVYPYREDDSLGGYDPYAASKATCELAINSYRSSFFAREGAAVASTRAGNVIGGGDWAAERLLPDLVRAWESNKALIVRRPNAIRPWQHVVEPLYGYLVLAQSLWENRSLAQAYNMGPRDGGCASVREVVSLARRCFGRGEVSFGDSLVGPHESGMLALETSKARKLLGLEPRWPLATAIKRTIEWYLAFGQGMHAQDLCLADLASYEEKT